MTSHRRLLPLAWILAALAALLVPAPHARADDGTLQVNKEVNTVAGGTPVTLTARLDGEATAERTVNFSVHSWNGAAAPAGTVTPLSTTCQIPLGAESCQVVFNSTAQGTALIRAHIGSGDNGEGRLSDDSPPPVLGLGSDAADCRSEDDEGFLLGLGGQSTCTEGEVEPGGVPEPDGTDVVQITWTSFVDARVDCDDSNPANGEDTEYNPTALRQETYSCLVTRIDNNEPIAGAIIDAERLGGLGDPDGETPDGTADHNDLCVTDASGRCTANIQIQNDTTGATTICFWAEPGNADPPVADDVFSMTGSGIDGGGCSNEPVDEVEGNDISDAVMLDIDHPRPSRLDAGPELAVTRPGSAFVFAARVWDQFDNAYLADTRVLAEYFTGSPLDSDGNTPETPDSSCQTGTHGLCAFPLTPAQSDLGTNLVCIWLDTETHRVDEMIGNGGDIADGSCGDADDVRFDEVPTDPTSDGDGDTLPRPVTDGRDIIRLKVESQPFIAQSRPEATRQGESDVLRVIGSSFHPGVQITVSGSGVEVGPTSRVSAFELAATVAVSPDAPAGPRDVIVTNWDGGSATCGGCFDVTGQGYWLVGSDGGIFAFGDADFAGSTGGETLNEPIVGMASTPSGDGYWLVASDGGIFTFGDARFYGSTGGIPLNRPIVGMASTPSGDGYWLVASDGGIFAFGDARFYGSTGGISLNQPIVGLGAHPSGRGYWLVASDGGIFAFGTAAFHGSTGAIRLNQPIVDMAPSSSGDGYWLVAADGGIFAFGDAGFHGSTGSMRLNRPIVGMAIPADGGGYWLVASDGGIFAFGAAGFHGSTGALRLNHPIIGLARR